VFIKLSIVLVAGPFVVREKWFQVYRLMGGRITYSWRKKCFVSLLAHLFSRNTRSVTNALRN
jgi:hypothetical protein